MKRRFTLPASMMVFGLSAIGCGASLKSVPLTIEPPPVAPIAVFQPPVLLSEDPVTRLIALSQQYLADGERELAVGHLEQAKAAFDLSVDVLLQSVFGARTEPRIREHFDRLVDRVSSYEITALAQGDGFAEKRTEPAVIDELLEIATFDRPAPTDALHAAVRTDLAVHDIEIPLNAKVLSYIELFRTRLHHWFSVGLDRGAKYLPMIQSVFRSEGLPLDLAYVPLIESAFNPNAQSRARARGLWQFMRATATENGLKQDWYIDERSDPEKATLAAASYLTYLGKMFNGDWHLALASYNGGPGRVNRAIARARKDNFWSLAQTSRFLPRETREYVPMILAAIVIAKNPGQYGFDVPLQAPMTYEQVSLSEPVDLRRVAEWTGATIDDIQALNPELRRWTTPVRYPNYEIKVPAGSADALRVRLAEASPEDLTALQWHTVKRRESLLTIARKLKVKQADLAEANYLSIRSKVRPGQRLIIPRAPTTLLAARTEKPVPETLLAATRMGLGEASFVSTELEPPRLEPQKVLYRVKRGDTLFSIARLFDTTVEALKTWNSRIQGSRINIGDRLTIFATRLGD